MRDQPFRFLDLPAELRLMVYERLPIKTTHHKLDYNNLTLSQLRNGEDESVTFVHEAIAGSAVLFICRQIYSEARSLLHSRAQALQSRSIKIITSPDVIKTDEFHSHLACLAHAACGANTDIRHFLRKNHRDIYYHYRPQQPGPNLLPNFLPDLSRKIEIAIVANDENMPAQRTSVRDWTWDLRYGYTALRVKFRDNFEGPLQSVAMQDLHVTCRMARRNTEERAQIEGYRSSFGLNGFRTSSHKFYLGFGADVDQEEWEKEWAEGERFGVVT
jgi:hypothetical protein